MARTKSTTKAQQAVQVPAVGKFFYRDRGTGDYPMYLDGQLIGYAGSADEAETQLDNEVFELMRRAA